MVTDGEHNDEASPPPEMAEGIRAELQSHQMEIDEQAKGLKAQIEKFDAQSKQADLGEVTDEIGARLTVMTFSPVSVNVRSILKEVSRELQLVTLKLHEFTSETDLTNEIQNFFNNNNGEGVLVLQADPVATSFQRIQHARNICERERAAYALRKQQQQQQQQQIKQVHVVAG